jgi:hypothetical protein
MVDIATNFILNQIHFFILPPCQSNCVASYWSFSELCGLRLQFFLKIWIGVLLVWGKRDLDNACIQLCKFLAKISKIFNQSQALQTQKVSMHFMGVLLTLCGIISFSWVFFSWVCDFSLVNFPCPLPKYHQGLRPLAYSFSSLGCVNCNSKSKCLQHTMAVTSNKSDTLWDCNR